MFSKLLKSEARKSILKIFTENSRQKYYLRELANKIQYSPGSLQRELNGLVADDILFAEKVGNLRFFSLNTKNPYLKDLKRYLIAHPDLETDQPPKPVKNPKKAAPKAPAAQKGPPIKAAEPQRPPAQPVSPGMKPGTKPVLAARPAAIAPEAPEVIPQAPFIAPEPPPMVAPAPVQAPQPLPAPVAAAPVPTIPAPPPAPIPAPVFTPSPSPIHQPVDYSPQISPFSKPVLSKPDLPKLHIAPHAPKLETQFDYPNEAFAPYPSEAPLHAPEAITDYPDNTHEIQATEPLYYQTEPTTQNEPPEEASSDIRLDID